MSERLRRSTSNSLTDHMFPCVIDSVKEKVQMTHTRWNNVIIAEARGNRFRSESAGTVLVNGDYTESLWTLQRETWTKPF